MSIIEKAIAKLNTTKQGGNPPVAGGQQPKSTRARNTAEGYPMIHIKSETMAASGFVAPDGQAPILADEFRRIKRPLLNNAFGSSAQLVENGNVIMVTSSLPGEGKSFTAINLALSIALEKDYTVLLIDADVAMSKITNLFGLGKQPGLTDMLEENDIYLSDLLIKTDYTGLSILPAGRKTSFATELLASNVMKEVVNELSTRYNNRIIIFDSPPLLSTPESAVLAEQMGQIVMVVEANKTPQSAVMESVNLLNKDKAIGLVLNKTSKGIGYPQYGSYYSYGQDANAK